MNFRSGDPIEITSQEVYDWLIVNLDGTEEGNLQGKALDLLQVGVAAFIVELHPEDGEYVTSDIVSVINPKTQQEVIDLVPDEVLAAIDHNVAELHMGVITESGV